jgi:phosphoribosyl 1,2-cyclic phosphodiesterase
MLYIASLNSGSNGNCYYVGNDQEAILVDAGITCRETERRMQAIGLHMDKVKAVFISHEHTDHISGLTILAKKYNLPVYITDATRHHGRLQFQDNPVYTFRPYQPVTIGQLSVKPFPKFHDAAEPHSFIVSGNNINIGVFTDIGAPCEHVITHFQQCHAAFLEANYDDDMLDKGRYPYFLKNRIRGGNGHLSNKQALELFTKYRAPFMSHLLLSHLSKDNNCPNLVQNLFTQHAGATSIVVASRFEATPVYQVKAGLVSNNTYQPAYQRPVYVQGTLW